MGFPAPSGPGRRIDVQVENRKSLNQLEVRELRAHHVHAQLDPASKFLQAVLDNMTRDAVTVPDRLEIPPALSRA